MTKPVLLLPRKRPLQPRSMVTRRSLPVRRSLWDRIHDDLGRPPRPAAADALVAALVLFVLLFAMSVGYQP